MVDVMNKFFIRNFWDATVLDAVIIAEDKMTRKRQKEGINFDRRTEKDD